MNDVTQRRLLQTFVTLADTLVDDYDVVDLLQLLVDTCRDVLDMTAAGILLADARGELELVASTSEASRLVEMMQLSAEAGPCIESFRSGQRVSVRDIATADDEWRQFRESAIAQGFRAMDALPLRLRDSTIGTLNLLRDAPGAAPEDAVLAAQAFADVATIGILHERTLRESAVLSRQLQTALNSRIVIEQAKGVVSHTSGVSIDEAFTLMREHARSHNVGLSVVAARIVDRSLRL
ncbi:GAF domain-containing protein [Microbacterium sp. cf046]|uniref:GAF and ANTAR domain-containing protein n=1 Tax=Microbacterium sp. cf046 TaxID=1761803 RepID=UPI0008E3F023|nr:GAF and ANTAR domain-containing protein [Microbacterium sp. cf046]SFS08461.1 GAF domain-containing protein [Microbacterium sp. cf046]